MTDENKTNKTSTTDQVTLSFFIGNKKFYNLLGHVYCTQCSCRQSVKVKKDSTRTPPYYIDLKQTHSLTCPYA